MEKAGGVGKVGRWVRLGESRLIRIASRASRLALAQSEEVLGKLAEAWPQHRFEIAVIDTRGDREIDRPLPQIGGKGLSHLPTTGCSERFGIGP